MYADLLETEDVQRWLDRSLEMLATIEDLLNSNELNVHEKRRCQSYLSEPINLKNRLKNLLIKIGGRIHENQPDQSAALQESIRWDDMLSIFENRVSSCQITNLVHKDVKSFLRDAESLFEEKVQGALTVHSSLMVSIELSAEYVIN